MIFYRILAFAALLVGGIGCTPESGPPQTSAPQTATPSPLPADVVRIVGPVDSTPALQALVQRVGRKLVAQSGISGSFQFHVLDQPQPNAHALPSGYVFVTRGLLAMLDDEAELAAVLGHEIGHITQRHAAARAEARRGAINDAVNAATTSGSVEIGRSVAQDRMVDLRRYSREQELEADRVSLGYLTRAGYRGDAMVSVIEKLQRQSRLEDRLMGRSSEAADRTRILSTHPAPNERLVALRGIAASGATGEAGVAELLAAIDGMSVDDAPEEGFVRGPAFLHPTMRLAFEVPADFRLFNERDGVYAIARDRSAMFFSCRSTRVSGRLSDWMRNNVQPTPIDIQSAEIGGAEAAIGARARGSDTGVGQFRYVIVRHADGICYFNLFADGPDRDRRIEAMVAAARSFRTLSTAEAGTLRPYRLRIAPGSGESAAVLAARLPYADLKLDRLLTLNGVDDASVLAGRARIKIVEP